MGYKRNTAYTRCITTNNPLSSKLHEPLFASKVQVQTMRPVIFPHNLWSVNDTSVRHIMIQQGINPSWSFIIFITLILDKTLHIFFPMSITIFFRPNIVLACCFQQHATSVFLPFYDRYILPSVILLYCSYFSSCQ